VSDPEEPADLSFPRDPAAVVAIATDAPGFSVEAAASPPPPWVVTVSGSSPKLFLAVVRTTLEAGVTPASVLNDATVELAAHRAEGGAPPAAAALDEIYQAVFG
jgi:hypothetical protein